MDRLVFVIPNSAAFSAFENWARAQCAPQWRVRLWTKDSTVSSKYLAAVTELALSDIPGLAWRGAVWAGALSALLVTLLWPYSREVSTEMQVVVRYALPASLVFFGIWLGGLLGTMRGNPQYEVYRDAWSVSLGLVFVDCPACHQRLLRRELASNGLSYLDSRRRYFYSYRYPQNHLGGRRAL